MSKPAIQKLSKIPILYYEEESDGGANPIPYIPMEVNEQWPVVLFVQEYRETGETEPDDEGNPQPICDMIMHKYVDMEHLGANLTPEANDMVRVALGLEPLAVAQEKGQKILDKVYENVNAKSKEESTVH
jgi:hypothetical protein